MFNIFEGSKEEKAAKLQERLEILKRAREDGFFDEERIEPIPEIVADGHGPDDRTRPSPFVRKQPEEPRPTPEGEPSPTPPDANTAVLPARTPEIRPYQPRHPCKMCNEVTWHITYGVGFPTWHCVVCCTCDWCMATVEQQTTAGRDAAIDREKAREKVKQGRQALYDAVNSPPDDHLFFCTRCGAGLRCGVCNNEATGRHCDLCGRTIGDEGFCTDCWKEADLDG